MKSEPQPDEAVSPSDTSARPARDRVARDTPKPACETVVIWLIGIVLTTVASVLYLAENGPVADESVGTADILSGHIPYAHDHPHFIYSWRAPSLSNAVSLIARPYLSREFVSAARNVLFIALTILVPYLIVVYRTGRIVLGLATVTLVLAGCALSFRGVYPTFLFPEFQSHGHVGAHLALLTVFLLGLGFARAGGFGLGALISLHPVFGAFAWAWAALWTSLPWRGIQNVRQRISLLWLAVGLAVSGATFAFYWTQSPNDIGALASTDGALTIRDHFIAYTDLHRKVPPVGSQVFTHGYFAHFLLWAALAWSLLLSRRNHAPTRERHPLDIALLSFSGLTWMTVWLAWLAETNGLELPPAIVTFMPYRFSVLSQLIIPALLVIAIHRAVAQSKTTESSQAGWIALGSALCCVGAVAAYVCLIYPASRHAPRFQVSVVAFLSALPFAIAVYERKSAAWSSFVPMITLGIAWYVLQRVSQTPVLFAYAAAIVSAFALALVVRRLPTHGRNRNVFSIVSVAMCAGVLVAASLTPSSSPQKHYRNFERRVNAHLAAVGASSPIAVAFQPGYHYQAKLDSPILMESESLWIMTYVPETASYLADVTKELYGVDYSSRAALDALAAKSKIGPYAPFWTDAWKRRSVEQWQTLAEKYGFEYVISSRRAPLAFEPIIAQDGSALYRIPKR